jgi:hypothetical protein
MTKEEAINQGLVIVDVLGQEYVLDVPEISNNVKTIDRIYGQITGKSIINRFSFKPEHLDEYKRILQKKSKLSSRERKYIVHKFNQAYKLIKNQ